MDSETLILQPTATAQWHDLVTAAEQRQALKLSHTLESYLVFLLMRFASKPDMAASVLAVDFLEGVNKTGQLRQEALQELGDKCLLYAGLFPGRAEQRHVNISYFVFLGQSAYATLANHASKHSAVLYKDLVEHFVELMDLLQTLRANNTEDLTLLQAEQLWADTRSQHALHVLRRQTQGTLLPHTFIEQLAVQ